MATLTESQATRDGSSLRVTFVIRHERHEAGMWFDDRVLITAQGVVQVTLTSEHQVPGDLKEQLDIRIRAADITVPGWWSSPIEVMLESTPRFPVPTGPLHVVVS